MRNIGASMALIAHWIAFCRSILLDDQAILIFAFDMQYVYIRVNSLLTSFAWLQLWKLIHIFDCHDLLCIGTLCHGRIDGPVFMVCNNFLGICIK